MAAVRSKRRKQNFAPRVRVHVDDRHARLHVHLAVVQNLVSDELELEFAVLVVDGLAVLHLGRLHEIRPGHELHDGVPRLDVVRVPRTQEVPDRDLHLGVTEGADGDLADVVAVAETEPLHLTLGDLHQTEEQTLGIDRKVPPARREDVRLHDLPRLHDVEALCGRRQGRPSGTLRTGFCRAPGARFLL